MSNYRLLYYPDFYPDVRWLRPVLLLADEVSRIVPADVTLDDPDELSALKEAIPGCLTATAPKGEDLGLDWDVLPRLSKAFRCLERITQDGKPENITVRISDGRVSVAGYSFLHHEKISRVFRAELKRHGLLIDGLAGALGQTQFDVVDKRASDLLVSLLASRLASRTGCDAVTDRPLPFIVNALTQLAIERGRGDGRPEGALLSAMASLLIPSAVNTLGVADYSELRSSYADVRRAFKALTSEMSRSHRLGRIEDAKLFQRAVDDAADELFAQYQAHRRSALGKSFRNWTPLCVGSLLAAAVAWHTHDPVKSAGVSFAFQVLEKGISTRQQPSSERERTFHMLAGLRRNILTRRSVAKLV